MDWFVGYDCTRQKPQPLIRNYMEMLGVKLMYDNQSHDKHGFYGWNTKCMKSTEIKWKTYTFTSSKYYKNRLLNAKTNTT